MPLIGCFRNMAVVLALVTLLGCSTASQTKPPTLIQSPTPTTEKPLQPAPIVPTKPSISINLLLGNPSGAMALVGTPDNYLLVKPQYVVSYNNSKGTPNWVSWQLNKSWLGTTDRTFANINVNNSGINPSSQTRDLKILPTHTNVGNLYKPDFKLAQVTSNVDLTGIWTGDDGGTYYLHQIGNQVWWYGESGAFNPGFSNVYQGTIQGGFVTGNWGDVPKGRTLSNGGIVLQITSPNRLDAVFKTGGFSGSVWTR
ncbi:MAG: DNA/RNA non-specific endonuclease [Nostoc sp.]